MIIIKPPLGTHLDWGQYLLQGLVAHYPFAGTGSLVSDISYNNNHIEMRGNLDWSPGGLIFDGNGDDGAFPTMPVLSDAFTFTFRYRPIGTQSTYDTLIQAYDNDFRIYFIGGTLAVYDGVTFHYTGGYQLIDNQINCWSFVYDGDTNIDQYVDGVLQASWTVNALDPVSLRYLGVSNFRNANWISCELQEMTIHDRPLSASEISILHNNPTSIYYMPNTALWQSIQSTGIPILRRRREGA
jgi:hypothetical protein